MNIWRVGNVAHHVTRALGYKGTPARGFNATVVGGVVVYANPLTGEKPARGKRHTHRLYAICPKCEAHVPAGRLMQHIDTAICKKGA